MFDSDLNTPLASEYNIFPAKCLDYFSNSVKNKHSNSVIHTHRYTLIILQIYTLLIKDQSKKSLIIFKKMFYIDA